MPRRRRLRSRSRQRVRHSVELRHFKKVSFDALITACSPQSTSRTAAVRRRRQISNRAHDIRGDWYVPTRAEPLLPGISEDDLDSVVADSVNVTSSEPEEEDTLAGAWQPFGQGSNPPPEPANPPRGSQRPSEPAAPPRPLRLQARPKIVPAPRPTVRVPRPSTRADPQVQVPWDTLNWKSLQSKSGHSRDSSSCGRPW